ncbi:insulinase family protein [Actinoplanes sp. DH11]|uniref:insulinase family protein n=1 Tax=Actinoplanes sp. DH11 TaxID=2857011 RepID=UPI001E3F5652|nr:insulinase family protein [Actinoplanes sp. DH11]
MITQLEVGGVPAVLAPTTGPMHAGLVFRVGFADEPLARRGITHLVEHLALHSFGVADYHYNGATGVEYTFFHMQGAEDDIVAFLNGVCAALGDLPMHRLPTEKEILRTEESTRGEGPTEAMPLWRHGARDYGVATYPEWGLGGITPDDLRAWVARYFTVENAALWIAGPGVPAGLDLKLPHGERRPAPAPSSALPVRPAFFPGPSNVVAWDAVVDRSTTAGVFSGVLERSLFRSLRQESGLSYTVQAGYEPRSGGRAVITAFADALPEKQSAVLGGFVDVLASLRLGLVEQSDVTAVVNQRIEELNRAEENGTRLPGQAFNLLAGRPVQSAEELLAELRAVTRDGVAEVGKAAFADGLLMTPGRTGADWAGYTPAPRESDSAVDGTRYRSLDDEDLAFVAGERGVSLVSDGSAATVRYDECAVLLAWPDGARRFVGHDGIQVHFEPTLFPNGHAVVPALDARVRPELRATMPSRDPERIPAPREPAKPAGPTGGKAGPIAMLVIFLPLLLFFGGLGLIMGVYAFGDDVDVAVEITISVVFLAIAGVAGWAVFWAVNRLRGR